MSLVRRFDITLTASEVEKDLEVNIVNNFNFKHHNAMSTAMANKAVGINLSNETFLKLYRAIVRLILEYGNTVWQPHAKCYARSSKTSQNELPQTALYLKREVLYKECLRILRLPSLELSQNRGDRLQLPATCSQQVSWLSGLYRWCSMLIIVSAQAQIPPDEQFM